MSLTPKEAEEVNAVVRFLSPSPVGSSDSQETKQASGQKLQEFDGEIGLFTKNQNFIPMTNFSVRCTGYVVDNSTSTSARGFLFKVIPKDRVQIGDDVEDFDDLLAR